MKKLPAIICSVVLSSMLLIQVSTASVEVLRQSNTIYAGDFEAIGQAIESDSGNLSRSLKAFNVSVDVSTIMPIYKASIFDFAESGTFALEPLFFEGGQMYVSDTLGDDGEFAGVAVFTVDGNVPDVHMMAPTTDKAKSVDFRANSARISALLQQKSFETEDFDAKFVQIDGIGYVYFLSNASGKVLVAAGLKGGNGNIFGVESGGIVAIDDSLMAKAKLELEAYHKQLEYLSSLKPGENPQTGGGAPAFMVDNAQYMKAESHDNGLLVVVPALIALLASCLL